MFKHADPNQSRVRLRIFMTLKLVHFVAKNVFINFDDGFKFMIWRYHKNMIPLYY